MLKRVLPAFEPLSTVSGTRRGQVRFDRDVPILILLARSLRPDGTWHWANMDYETSQPAPWMSLTPMELLSLSPGVQFARGRTIVAGLGLGWQLIEAAKSRRVTSLVLVEKDPDIANFMLPRITPHLQGKPFEVVIGDAYEMVPKLQADTLLVDIYPRWGRIAYSMDRFRRIAPHIKRQWGWGIGGAGKLRA